MCRKRDVTKNRFLFPCLPTCYLLLRRPLQEGMEHGLAAPAAPCGAEPLSREQEEEDRSNLSHRNTTKLQHPLPTTAPPVTASVTLAQAIADRAVYGLKRNSLLTVTLEGCRKSRSRNVNDCCGRRDSGCAKSEAVASPPLSN